MSTADAPGGSDGSGGVQKLTQLKRSRGVHRGVLTRRATAIRQAGEHSRMCKPHWSS